MTDPKTPPKSDPKDDKVVIPQKTTSAPASPAKPAPAATSSASSASKTVPNDTKRDPRSMSSVGADLHPDAPTTTVDGKLAIDASKPTVAAAPAPTPAEAVVYPPTGGLPDTGPNSKYVLGTDSGPELYNRDGQRVNADGQLLDDTGAVIPGTRGQTLAENRRVTDKNMQRQERFVSQSTKDEMEAGKRALKNR